ncbi:hypothetical protein OE88DRAFT_534845 [Heliocybe sulcata]|uniref:Uncharacterized protein n=1 Tax=Heliocybe sulcata TaxID=5364 RepID=A0A5C3N406_9AGAM|nr:hypothetical protein OE88DRAFT_534845 [Heliocybe sulcata]
MKRERRTESVVLPGNVPGNAIKLTTTEDDPRSAAHVRHRELTSSHSKHSSAISGGGLSKNSELCCAFIASMAGCPHEYRCTSTTAQPVAAETSGCSGVLRNFINFLRPKMVSLSAKNQSSHDLEEVASVVSCHTTLPCTFHHTETRAMLEQFPCHK